MVLKLFCIGYVAQGHNIQQLYLRKNNITDVNELSHLKDLTNLKVGYIVSIYFISLVSPGLILLINLLILGISVLRSCG